MSMVAETIRAQIGHKALAMIGASNLMAAEQALHFKVGRNGRGVTHIVVELNGATDTYRMQFLKIRGTKIATVAEHSDVYAEDLRRHIEENTGLFTSL